MVLEPIEMEETLRGHWEAQYVVQHRMHTERRWTVIGLVAVYTLAFVVMFATGFK